MHLIGYCKFQCSSVIYLTSNLSIPARICPHDELPAGVHSQIKWRSQTWFASDENCSVSLRQWSHSEWIHSETYGLLHWDRSVIHLFWTQTFLRMATSVIWIYKLTFLMDYPSWILFCCDCQYCAAVDSRLLFLYNRRCTEWVVSLREKHLAMQVLLSVVELTHYVPVTFYLSSVLLLLLSHILPKISTSFILFSWVIHERLSSHFVALYSWLCYSCVIFSLALMLFDNLNAVCIMRNLNSFSWCHSSVPMLPNSWQASGSRIFEFH